MPAPSAANPLARFVTPEAGVMAGAVLVALVMLYHNWFYVQGRHSYTHMEDWGHAFFVPAISLYLVWRRRAELAQEPFRTFWPGVLPLAMGVLSYIFFSIGSITNHMAQGCALVLTIFGACLLLMGPRPMRWLILPIGFLLLGVTISESVMTRLTTPLKLLAAQSSYVLLAAIAPLAGYSIDISGNVLTITDGGGRSIPLDVAEQCSGLRMVVAFVALAAITALVGCRYWWQRVMLLLLAAPVAIVINIVRVAALALLSLADPEFARGDAHTFIGTLLLVPGMGLFMLVVWVLNSVVNEDPQGSETPAPAAPASGNSR